MVSSSGSEDRDNDLLEDKALDLATRAVYSARDKRPGQVGVGFHYRQQGRRTVFARNLPPLDSR